MVESSSSQTVVSRSQALYRSTVQQAASASERLIASLIQAGIDHLNQRIAKAQDFLGRDRLQDCARQLQQHQAAIVRAYPQALQTALARAKASQRFAGSVPAALNFDQLEQMDSSEVQSSMVMAQVQHVAEDASLASQAELDALVSGLQNYPTIRPELNPIRAENYVAALRSVLDDTGVADAVQVEWLPGMGPALGRELNALFPRLCASLRGAGVTAAGQPAVGGNKGEGRRKSHRAGDDKALTLSRLRMLLAGELDAPLPSSRVDQFAEHFDREFQDEGSDGEEPTTDFQNTIPHALEALTEMKQVARVVQKLELRESGVSQPASEEDAMIEAERSALRARARNQAQMLSLEVVELMVDNIAQDVRLLPPVQKLVRSLEPALLRLSLVDPRFFTDRQHPARLLLQECTQQSLAFKAEHAEGFAQFLQDMTASLEPLKKADIASAEPFGDCLQVLQQGWKERSALGADGRAQAVEVLQHAESRSLLAEKIGREIETLPAALTAPKVVVNFLCGAWAQAVAQARLKQGVGSPEATQYQALIPELLWSVQRDLGRDGIGKLTKLVPRMVPVLRQGLNSIAYPDAKTSAFFESLMRIHQRAFKAGAEAGDSQLQGLEEDRVRWVEDGDPWVDPQEAKTSNFMGLEADSQMPEQAEPEQALLPDLDMALERLALWDQSMVLGTWVEIYKAGEWQRLQLTWASPHGTLYLFTSPFGQTQSMTRRTIDRLVEADKLRLVASGSLVDGAMDAVARTALQNSLQGKLQ